MGWGGLSEMSNVKKSKRCQEVQKMSRSPKYVKNSKKYQEVQKMSKMSQLCQNLIMSSKNFTSTVKVFEQLLSQSSILPTIVTSLHTPENCLEFAYPCSLGYAV